jgi:hypothetical protein
MSAMMQTARARDSAFRFAEDLRRIRSDHIRRNFYTVIQVEHLPTGTGVTLGGVRYGTNSQTPCEAYLSGTVNPVVRIRRFYRQLDINMETDTATPTPLTNICFTPAGQPYSNDLSTPLPVSIQIFDAIKQGKAPTAEVNIDVNGAIETTYDTQVQDGVADNSLYVSNDLNDITPKPFTFVDPYPIGPTYETSTGQVIDPSTGGGGGATASCGGATASCGGAATSCGGATASCGGATFACGGCGGGTIASCGGAGAAAACGGCGGATASCGGATASCGGATASCGGSTASYGGATASCGGATASCGGATASWGGATASCGGATASCGGATAGSCGGASCGGASCGGASCGGASCGGASCGGASCGGAACGGCGGGCGGGCFVAGTQVATADGLRPIESIAEGDKVLAYDPGLGERGVFSVKEAYSRTVDELVIIEVDGEVIETTDEHPFWVDGSGFVRAKDLTAGDMLVGLSGERRGIEKVSTLRGTFTVHNIHVDNAHTYFVTDMNLLVHNTSAAPQQLY